MCAYILLQLTYYRSHSQETDGTLVFIMKPMRTRVVRTIHPVGQGAFYSERFYDSQSDKPAFTVVYDCGSESKFPLNEEIDIFTSSLDEIDILFISHYHCDHFNGVKKLLNSGIHIKNVILPFLDKAVRQNLCSLQSSISQFSDTVIYSDPYEELKDDMKDTHFIYIGGSVNDSDAFGTFEIDGDNRPEGSMPGRIIDLSDLRTRHSDNIYYLPSNSLIGQPFWFYMPFVKDFSSDMTDIEETVDKINEIVREYEASGDKSYVESKNKDLDNQYRHFKGVFNNTSMMVFSAPININENNEEYIHRRHYVGCRFPKCHVSRHISGCIHQYYYPSCLYTGDIVLSDDVWNQIDSAIKGYRIGTFQLPHHGADNGWQEKYVPNCWAERRTTHFFSYGLNNSYKHPGKTNIDYFVKNRLCIHGVNELPHTEIIQIILTNKK